jgi:hypothetical protein
MAEKGLAYPRNTSDTFRKPTFFVLVSLVDLVLRLAITIEVVRDKVEIAVVNNTVDKRSKLVSISEHVALDGIEDCFETRIQLETFAVHVGVTKVLDIFAEVANY